MSTGCGAAVDWGWNRVVWFACVRLLSEGRLYVSVTGGMRVAPCGSLGSLRSGNPTPSARPYLVASVLVCQVVVVFANMVGGE